MRGDKNDENLNWCVGRPLCLGCRQSHKGFVRISCTTSLWDTPGRAPCVGAARHSRDNGRIGASGKYVGCLLRRRAYQPVMAWPGSGARSHVAVRPGASGGFGCFAG